MDAIGEFHHDDPNIVGHGEQHFAKILSLLGFLRSELNLTDLGDAIDDVSDFGSKNRLDVFKRYQCVFHYIVKQADTDVTASIFISARMLATSSG